MVTGTAADEIDGLRRALGAQSLRRIGPHLTLVPPLNVRNEDLHQVLEHVRRCAGSSGPVALELGPPVSFWPRAPVLYLEVAGDVAAVEALQDALATGPLAPPASRPRRPFVPHVTLDQQMEPERLAHALAALGDYRASCRFEGVAVLAQSVESTESTQSAERRWQVIADAPLGRPRMVGRGTLDLELSVVHRLDVELAGWADGLWQEYARARYGDEARPDEPYAVVARVGGAPVGVASGEIRGPLCHLGRLVVSPPWRDHGVGSHLLRAVERYGAERGCTRTRLETATGGAAERFCAERGYVAVATLPRWREAQDFVVMERSLPLAAEPPGPAAPRR